MLKVIKRDCTEADFDEKKIYNAIIKAMKFGSGIVDEDVAITTSIPRSFAAASASFA